MAKETSACWCWCACRLQSAQTAGPGLHHPRANVEQPHHTQGHPPQYPSPVPASHSVQSPSSASTNAPPASVTDRLLSSSSQDQPDLAGLSPERPASFTHALSQAPAGSPYRPTKHTLPQTDSVQLSLHVSEASSSVQAILSPSSGTQLISELNTDGRLGLGTSEAAPAAAPGQQDEESAASGSQQETAEQGQRAAMEEEGTDFLAVDPDDLAELQKLLIEERTKTVALIGKCHHPLLTMSACAFLECISSKELNMLSACHGRYFSAWVCLCGVL